VLTLSSLAVSLRTTRFNVQKSAWYSLFIECFVQFSDHIVTLTSYITNWLVFITLVESVYSAVWTDSLYKTDYILSVKG
jgi:hypothetical protein